MTSRLEKFYKDEVVPALMKQFGYTNPMEVPKLVKVTLNMGVGEAATNKKILENAVGDMTKISGQKPVVTKSRISVASFKIRDGWPIGCKTTLRRHKMYEFLDRLINISLPRVRDFRGVSGHCRPTPGRVPVVPSFPAGACHVTHHLRSAAVPLRAQGAVLRRREGGGTGIEAARDGVG